MFAHSFFERPSPIVARNLIGKILARKIDGRIWKATTTETEAYGGPSDLASHARFGRTNRNAAMYGEAGSIYVYRIYGLHWMLNLVCGPVGRPSAVLVRGCSDIVGPARLAKAFKIDGTLNNKPLGNRSGLWIEDPGQIQEFRVRASPRIGVGYAGKDASRPWRFIALETGVKA